MDPVLSWPLRIPRRASRTSLRVLVATCLWFAAVAPSTAQQVWLAPRPPSPGGGGIADWHDLFQGTGAWPQLASRIQIMNITAGFVMSASDAELRAMSADVAAHHIALDISLQSIALAPGEKCGHGEGYGPPAYSAQAATRLAAMGVKLQYIRLDEPLWFGHYVDGPGGCQLAAPDIAHRVALNVREYLRFFPDAAVGTIETVPGAVRQPDWAPNFRSFLHALTTEIGRPVTSLHVDVNWQTPEAAATVRFVADFARAEGLQFGVIYNADATAKTDEEWIAAARRHIDEVETGQDVKPDHAII
jgi:hypothetical protein